MKKIYLVFFCIFATKTAFTQPIIRHTIYEDTVLMGKVIEELTYSISNRGYYIPVYTRCDSLSEVVLTLSPTVYLFDNYKKRHEVSGGDFKRLLSSHIRENTIWDDICPDDFEYLYGRDRVWARSVAFVCDTQPQEFLAFIKSMDVDSLISWAFNSDGVYHRSFELLPIVAQQLMLYGILLHTGTGIESIWYIDILKYP